MGPGPAWVARQRDNEKEACLWAGWKYAAGLDEIRR